MRAEGRFVISFAILIACGLCNGIAPIYTLFLRIYCHIYFALRESMLVEHLDWYLEGLEADSLAHMVQDHEQRARQPPQKQPNGVQVSHFCQPQYQFARENALLASRRRADWSSTLAWEHVRTEDVLENPEQEFENLTGLPRKRFDDIVFCAAQSGQWTVSKEEPV